MTQIQLLKLMPKTAHAEIATPEIRVGCLFADRIYILPKKETAIQMNKAAG
jgi:hypothetical protein